MRSRAEKRRWIPAFAGMTGLGVRFLRGVCGVRRSAFGIRGVNCLAHCGGAINLLFPPKLNSSFRRKPESSVVYNIIPLMHEKQPAVYILANKRNGALYTGVTGNLPARIWKHKQGETAGFASQYGLNMLVFYELHSRMPEAIAREKQIKNWKRAWKKQLIEKTNPRWRDLYADIL